MVDLIVLIVLIFFILVGLAKGLGHYLLGLAITLTSLGIGWLNYKLKQEIITSLLIAIGVFFGLALVIWFLLKAKQKKLSTKPALSFANRFYGGIFGLIWGILLSCLLIFALDLLPSELVFKYNIKQKIRASGAYRLLQRLIPVKKVAVVENISYMSLVCRDKKAQKNLRKQPQFQGLLQNENLKMVMQSPELVQQLQDKDFPRLLSNPQILNLLNDGQFVEKLMQLDFKKALQD